ncbi:MAG: hypothetical protein H7Z12_13095 [Rhodospirillaceae bacterium]|nr:hypothetical protein [Rhodospirillales bacterium]
MKIAWDNAALDRPARTELRGWLLLALGALAVAGALALLLALSRAPGAQNWLPWGPDFFHKGLVTHVVFSFQIWLLAMLGALTVLAAPTGTRAAGFIGLGLAVAGSALLLVPTLSGSGEASLNNYVPVLVHPLYYLGLALLGAGVGLAALRTLLQRGAGVAGFAIQCMAVALLSALLCFVLAAIAIPAGTDIDHLNERLFWGGGHVLQVVNTMMLMLGWQVLAQRALGQGALPTLTAKAAFAALTLFAVAAPLVYVRLDVLGLAHRQAFTQMLWYGLPLPPLVMGAGLAWRLLRHGMDWRSPGVLALVLSLAVFALGGAAGFALGVADTRTPSHYHAVIGGVNLALMGLIHVVLLPLLRRGTGGWVRAQFHLYGFGQLLHALGFYLAGLAGVARKTAGAEQGLDSAFKLVSMGVVGLGGAIAVLGGVIFVVQVLGRLIKRESTHG